MRFKKIAIVILSLLVFTCSAHAASFVCDIVEVGSADAVYVRLTESSGSGQGFINRWFQCSSATIQNRILAVALTAQSLGLQVRAQVTSSSEWSQITGMYVVAKE